MVKYSQINPKLKYFISNLLTFFLFLKKLFRTFFWLKKLLVEKSNILIKNNAKNNQQNIAYN